MCPKLGSRKYSCRLAPFFGAPFLGYGSFSRPGCAAVTHLATLLLRLMQQQLRSMHNNGKCQGQLSGHAYSCSQKYQWTPVVGMEVCLLALMNSVLSLPDVSPCSSESAESAFPSSSISGKSNRSAVSITGTDEDFVVFQLPKPLSS